MTNTQKLFAEKVKTELGYDVDFSTYRITRGRGWSKSDGSCSASIMAILAIDGKELPITLLLTTTLRKYLRKNYIIEEQPEGLNTNWLISAKKG